MTVYLTQRDIDRLSKKQKKFSKESEMKREFDFVYNISKIDGNKLIKKEIEQIFHGHKTTHSNDSYDIENLKKCFYQIFSHKGKLTKNFILSLHKILFRNIDDKHAGKLRDHNVEIYGGHHLPPDWELVETAIDKMIQWYNESIEELRHPFEIATIFHLKFVSWHPFFDGNGRIANLLMNYILIKNKLPLMIVDFKKVHKYFHVLEHCQLENIEVDFVDWMHENY
ncbi:Fic family protein [archaeon]|jgi:Fic family protein|nr:Fic family protein [archaeon]MBT4350971.1 Fic family protein [archaeon]MBT4647662.1 Fic family protein [archaeon]MBT6822223.1 Fic family protein [archaeon]MBT7391482.1 Fic family protein [archaeon]